MSHKTYQELWDDADRTLRDLKYTTDPPPKDPIAAAEAAAAMADATAEGVAGQPDPADKEASREHFGLLYIKFIQIFKKLATAYDQMTHPQKRRVLRLLLEGTMGRLLELKGVLVEIECTDYNYFDDILADVKLTPEDIEIETPSYFRRENLKQLKERERILDDLGAKTLDPRVKPPEPEPEPMSVEQAIRIIQIHERARQGRLRAKFMQDIRAQEERERRQRENPNQSKMNKRQAVIILQKYTRGWLTRRHVWQQVAKDNLFIGMDMPPPLSKKQNPIIKLNRAVEARYVTQQQYETTYQAALINIRKKIAQVEGPDMRENMCDEIREWFVACRDQTGSFPDFPDTETGGSKKIFDPPPPPPPAEGADDDDGGKKGKKGKKGKGSGKKGKGKKGKKGKGDDDEEGPAAFPASVFDGLAQEGSKEFNRVWKKNKADKANLHQKHDSEMIKRDKRLEVEDELRSEVDELMREELKNLKAAVEGAGKKGKKGGKKKGGKKSKKGGKGGKKGKKGKDLTADRTPESLYKELVQEELVKRVSPVKMVEFMGQYSHLARHRLAKDVEPDPSYADIRRVITIYGILPLGSLTVHATQPDHVKSILLAGPPGVGKKTLVNAVAHELGATFFDITPANTAGKYTAKKGLDGVEGLLHKVFKMAKLYQPSVIWIGDACSVHVKKKDKEDPYDSTRMKKQLPKSMKELSKGDRVLIMGTDSKPGVADMKPLNAIYDKILMIPHPDYGSRLMLWRNALLREGCSQGHLTASLDLSSLAKISDGYTAGDITNVVRQVLTARRVQTLSYKPLTASEFVSGLARLDPIDPEQELEFKNWQLKTPMGKKRAALKAPAGEDDGGGKKGKKGKGGKKKKKK